MKVLIVYYSTYGHVHNMAEAIAEGVKEVDGAEAVMRRVPETLPDEVLEKMGAVDAQKPLPMYPSARLRIWLLQMRSFRHTDTLRQYVRADAPVPGCHRPTVGPGRPGGKGRQRVYQQCHPARRQESTILSFHISLLHHGFVIVGLPYAFQGQMRIDEVTGGSPYGASTIAGGSGERMPSENELDGARFQGRHVAEIANSVSTSRLVDFIARAFSGNIRKLASWGALPDLKEDLDGF